MAKTTKQIKGDKYEAFSSEILLLKNVTWTSKGVSFDEIDAEHKIEGESGAKHQIDIHLTSSKNPEYHLLCECKCYSQAIEKSLACSFVTVINDIRKSHKEWKIIPVFASDKGYNSGALKILKKYKISALDLEDVSDRIFTLTTTESVTSAKITISRITLIDGSEVGVNESFINYDRGDIWGAKNIIGFYEILDDNEKVIDDLVHYVGSFHTGKRKFSYGDSDKFLRMSDNKEIGRIDGIIEGCETNELGKHQEKIISSVKAVMKLVNGDSFKFNKDGTIEINNKNK